MQLTLRYNLPFTVVKVSYQGTSIDVSDVLIDTGSASTILAADIVAAMNILPLPQDTLRTIRGIGGREALAADRYRAAAEAQRNIRKIMPISDINFTTTKIEIMQTNN